MRARRTRAQSHLRMRAQPATRHIPSATRRKGERTPALACAILHIARAGAPAANTWPIPSRNCGKRRRRRGPRVGRRLKRLAKNCSAQIKAIEYVKVCSLYGAGFYYIPGTDTCIKIGGFVRAEWGHNTAGSLAAYVNGAQANYDRATDTHTSRTRVALSADTRTQTEYGTLRSYLRGGWQWSTNDAVTSNNNITYFDRGFIQFAGFTFGKTESFFDFYPTPVYSYQTAYLEGSSGGVGINVLAYTAQFGNGLSATISLEDHSFRQAPVIQLAAPTGGLTQLTSANTNVLITSTGAPATFRGVGADRTGGSEMYDIVGNIRVDQAWGSAQIQGALHEVRATYYGGAIANGHPSDEWGWAVGAGLTLKMPWDAKDTLSLQGVYCEGATRYCIPATFAWFRQPNFGIGYSDDGYLGAAAGSSIDLPQSWSLAAAFQHYWTPALRQSIYAQYASYETNSVQFDKTICNTGANSLGLADGCGDWSAYQIGSRLAWTPVANLEIGLDVIYTHLDSAFNGATVNLTSAANGAVTRSARVGDGDVWAAQFRVQRNFWP
jgi:hypothetical protein